MTSGWWVSQNQTYDAEVGGGYMWSPKANKDGSSSQSYDNMLSVRPGDIVFSFANQRIKSIGVAQSSATTAERPKEFGKAGESWSNSGWLVKVAYRPVSRPIQPRTHMDVLGPLLPAIHAPLQASGRGNQAYLFALPPALVDALLKLLGEDGARAKDTAAEVEVMNRTDIPTTKKEQLVEARRGQGIYRSNLFRIEKSCRLTGTADERFLIASHIKPWAVSSDFERLDGHNGLLLAPHVDRLFDRGLLSFLDDGTILRHQTLPDDIVERWSLDLGRNVGAFSRLQCEYLAFHRETVFGQRKTTDSHAG